LAKANNIINACLPHANKSIRIWITEFQGREKYFIEAFENILPLRESSSARSRSSSTISHGSILGDKKTEWKNIKILTHLYVHQFSGDTLGGVVAKLEKTITLRSSWF
jgi:LAO/AO transport system kinase